MIKKLRKIIPPIPSVMMLGVVSQIGQVLLLREFLMVFQGNELSIGIILSAWMIWAGTGSFLGSWLTCRFKDIRTPILVSSLAVTFVLPLTILLIRNVRRFWGISPGAYLTVSDILFFCFTLMAPVGLLIGAQFVFLAKNWRITGGGEGTAGASNTYITEALGNMAGGILFTLVLVRYFTPLQSGVTVSVFMLSAAILIYRNSNRNSILSDLKPGVVVAGTIIFLILVFPALEQIDNRGYAEKWKYFTPGYNLKQISHSQHGTISVVESENQYNFFQSGNLIFSTAGKDTLARGLEDQDGVIFAHFGMLQHSSPRKILLIGGGLRGTLAEIVEYPVDRIDYVELDKVLLDTARSFVSTPTLKALDHPKVNIIHTDGRLWIKSEPEQYDLIIVDIPDPQTAAINRYYTMEFFKEVQNILNPGGVFVIGTVSTPDLRNIAVANRNTTVYHTLNKIFKNVLTAGERYMFYFASDSDKQLTVDIAKVKKRFINQEVKRDDFTPLYLQNFLQKNRIRRLNWIVKNHGHKPKDHLSGPSPGPARLPSVYEQKKYEFELQPVNEKYFINSDFRPIGYLYSLMFWENLTRDFSQSRLIKLLKFNFRWLFLLVIAPLIIVISARFLTRNSKKRPDTRFGILFAVFTTGLSTMALQIVFIFSFQSIYGFVYEVIGLIVAVFMGGLAAGAYISHRYIEDKTNLNILAGIQLFIALLCIIVIFILPEAASLKNTTGIFIVFSFMTFSTGFINGLDFPVEIAAYKTLSKKVEKSTGLVYGLELLGACFGAILASVIIAPVHGIIACCIVAAGAGITSLGVLLICRRSYG